MNRVGTEQVTITVDDYEMSDSDAEESSPIPRWGKYGFMASLPGLVRLKEGNAEHSRIKKDIVSGMDAYGKETRVVAIHKNTYPGFMGQAQLATFKLFSQAIANKCGGNANVQWAWYGGARDDIANIVQHGFTHTHCKSGGSCGGFGVHLSHYLFSADGALSTEEDEDGLRHVLLCKVVLGKTEAVPDGSEQTHPSSEQFHSGVDNLCGPRRYIVWSAFMNSQISPECIVTFKSVNSSSRRRPPVNYRVLMHKLSRYLDSSKMAIINKHVQDYLTTRRKRNIPHAELLAMVAKTRQIAGVKLLRHVKKLHIEECSKMS